MIERDREHFSNKYHDVFSPIVNKILLNRKKEFDSLGFPQKPHFLVPYKQKY
jgi:hypothetical protein